MTGSVVIGNGSITDKFVAGSGSNAAVAGTFYTDNTDSNGTDYGDTLAGLANLITAQGATLGLNAQASTGGLTLTQNATAGHYTGAAITVASATNSLVDTTQGTYSTSTLGETSSTNLNGAFASQDDTLSGSLKFSIGSGPLETINMSDVAASGDASTVAGLISYIQSNSTTGADLGISAAWTPEGSNGFGSITLTSNTVGGAGTINAVTPTTLVDTTAMGSLAYTGTRAYGMGLSNGSNTVYDSTSGQTALAAGAATFAAISKSDSGVATVSYSDGAGQALNTTDLLNQADAQTALNDLNLAVSDVAAQDGYIGAQINTLNSVSQVMSTQQENVVSAQNAIQATDYASATANMSKYEILSQTGIAALAQANSVQQEVTKLLQ
jgi:flagellin